MSHARQHRPVGPDDAARAGIAAGRRVERHERHVGAVDVLGGLAARRVVDLAFRLGVDPKQSDQMVRGTVPLPHGSGKVVRVLVNDNAGVDATVLRDFTLSLSAAAGGTFTAKDGARITLPTELRTRVARLEPRIQAFEWFEPARALADAEERSGGILRELPLYGIAAGVKDIVATRGIPTRMGSRIFANHVPGRSAGLVRRLEALGGLMYAKTVTTEFAFRHPGKTRNPHDPTRTAGERVHSPVAKGECRSCHSPHAAEGNGSQIGVQGQAVGAAGGGAGGGKSLLGCAWSDFF